MLIFLPMLLAKSWSVENLSDLVKAFFAFSFLASSVYILNDIKDVDSDRNHPIKKNRPIAAGKVSRKSAWISIILLWILVAYFIYLIDFKLIFVAIAYLVLNLIYTYFLKKIRFYDILLLTSFYLIRIYFGAEVAIVPLTGWFMATMTFAFLSLSINKRYLELNVVKSDNLEGRNYQQSDQNILQLLMVNLAFASVIMLNIHAFFVFRVDNPWFYGILNLLCFGIIASYFDSRRNSNIDDPVEQVLTNGKLLLLTVALFTLYILIFTIK